MKNLSIGLNLVLLVAVIVLFYLHFSSPSPQTAPAKNKAVISTEAISGSVAYVNADSLFKNYKFYQELVETLGKNKQEKEAMLSSKQYEFEKKYGEFQEKIQKRLVTSTEAERLQADLEKQQQNLLMLRDKLTGEMMEAEAIMNAGLRDSIRSFLADYNNEHDFQVIISSTGDILFGKETLDVTEAVLNGLNSRYTPEAKKDEKDEEKKDK